jgi:TetR/AcrR family transcriptional regulator
MAGHEPREREPKRTRRWQRRRDEILAAAEEVFGERGFAGTRLEDVADRLEMRRPSLLYYFPDKEALYDATFEIILEQLWSRIEAAREAESPLERMEAIASAWIECLSERPHAARILLRQIVDVLPSRSEAVQERLRAILAAIREEIDEGVEAGLFKPVDARIYATTIAGASMFWVAARPVVERSFALDPLAPEMLGDFRDLLGHLTRRMLGAALDPSEGSEAVPIVSARDATPLPPPPASPSPPAVNPNARNRS